VEDLQNSSESENELAKEHYIAVSKSSLRKDHLNLDDPKYSGIKTDRKSIYEEENDEDDSFVSAKDYGSDEDDEDEDGVKVLVEDDIL
jgi:protein AATF/BFR2